MATIFKFARNLINTKSVFLAILATLYELHGHKWIGKELVAINCPPNSIYTLYIRHRSKGKDIGRLTIKTCIEKDIGA